MRFIRIGRFWLHARPAVEPTGLEQTFDLDGEDAETLRRHLAPYAVEWKPIVIGQHPRGPLGQHRGPDPTSS